MECGDLNVPVPSLDAWGGCLLHGLPVNINESSSQDSSAGRRQLREQVGVLELSEYWDIPCVFPSSSSGNSKKSKLKERRKKLYVSSKGSIAASSGSSPAVFSLLLQRALLLIHF